MTSPGDSGATVQLYLTRRVTQSSFPDLYSRDVGGMYLMDYLTKYVRFISTFFSRSFVKGLGGKGRGSSLVGGGSMRSISGRKGG